MHVFVAVSTCSLAQWMWAFFAVAHLLSQQGLAVQPTRMLLYTYVCHMTKQRVSVSLTVFTVQFVFRVQLRMGQGERAQY